MSELIDSIIDRHRKAVEDEIRRSIILVFRFQPAWSEGGLELALAERHVSMNDFWRHYKSLGIINKRIEDSNLWAWNLWYVPDNWNPEESNDCEATS